MKINKGNEQTSLGLIQEIGNQINQVGMDSTLSGLVGSLEAYGNPQQRQTIHSGLAECQNTISNALSLAGDPLQPVKLNTSIADPMYLSKRQRQIGLESAAISLASAANPRALRSAYNKSLEAFDDRTANYAVNYGMRAENGSMHRPLHEYEGIGMEAFENNALAKSMNHSVAFNFLAPVQDAALELLMPTIVLEPDQATFFYEVSIDRFWNGQKHSIENPVLDRFKRPSMIDGIRRPSLVKQDVLNIVPVVRDTGNNQNTDQFMPSSIMKYTTRKLMGTPIQTAPLLVGKEYNLLSLSTHPALVNGGSFDETDSLDANMAIENIYISLKDDDSEVVKFSLKNLERRNFIKSVQGQGMEMDLRFDSSDFTLTDKTKGVDGHTLTTLDAITKAGYRLRLRVQITGRANVEFGTASLDTATVSVVSAVKVDNPDDPEKKIVTKVSLDDGTLKAELAKLKLAVKWWDIYANRTNRNIRSQGYLVDSEAFTAKLAIGVRSPVRAQHPIDGSKDYPTVDKLVAMTRLQQSADGFAELFNYRDVLAAYLDDDLNDDDYTPGFYGVAKYLGIRPHYERIVLNVADFIKSSETKDILENARMGVVSVLQEAAARALVNSRWTAVATVLNNNQTPTPHFGIVCGQYLTLLLNVRGDLRLLGANFDHTVAPTINELMDDRIFMTLVSNKRDGFDPLGFGNTFWGVENLITVSPHAKNGSVVHTMMVAPRYQHVINLPVLIEFEVKGFKELVREYNNYRVTGEIETKEKA